MSHFILSAKAESRFTAAPAHENEPKYPNIRFFISRLSNLEIKDSILGNNSLVYVGLPIISPLYLNMSRKIYDISDFDTLCMTMFLIPWTANSWAMISAILSVLPYMLPYAITTPSSPSYKLSLLYILMTFCISSFHIGP